MQRRSRCNEDQDATRIKKQRGSSGAAGEGWTFEIAHFITMFQYGGNGLLLKNSKDSSY